MKTTAAIAVIALICLAAPAGAAVLIGGKNVRDHSLTGRDIRGGSLTGRQIKDGSLAPRDMKGLKFTDVGQYTGPTTTLCADDGTHPACVTGSAATRCPPGQLAIDSGYNASIAHVGAVDVDGDTAFVVASNYNNSIPVKLSSNAVCAQIRRLPGSAASSSGKRARAVRELRSLYDR